MVSVVPTFSPQDYYSELTGFTSAKRGSAGSAFTVRNERLAGRALRSLSFRLDDIEKGDAPSAVRAKLGRMLGNAVSYTVNLASWRDPSGALWQPNTTITVKAPGAMIYSDTELLIRDVFLRRNQGEFTASLGCVLPGSFGGPLPTRMPWEE
jgi:prophage tail gpP-like protein